MANTAEYACSLCGTGLKHTGSMGARDWYKCPKCGHESTRSDEHDYVPSQKNKKDAESDRGKVGRDPE